MSDDQLELGIEDDLKAVDEWVAAFPHQRLRDALARLRAERASIDEKIQEIDRRLASYESLRRPRSASNVDPAAASVVNPAAKAARSRPVTPRRAAFYKILEQDPDRAIPFSEIKERLVGMGFMQDTKSEIHSLNVMASKMVQRGEIGRERDGFYKFLPPHSEAPGTRRDGGEQAVTQPDVQSQDGSGSQGRGDPRIVTEGHPLPSEGAPGEAHLAGS